MKTKEKPNKKPIEQATQSSTYPHHTDSWCYVNTAYQTENSLRCRKTRRWSSHVEACCVKDNLFFVVI